MATIPKRRVRKIRHDRRDVGANVDADADIDMDTAFHIQSLLASAPAYDNTVGER